MKTDYDFDPKDWEDENYRWRLSSKQGAYREWGWEHEDLARHFASVCLHSVLMPSANGFLDRNLLNKVEENIRMRRWCSEHCTGWYMDGNFPDSRGFLNIFNRRFAFQNAEDAVLFKLTWA